MRPAVRTTRTAALVLSLALAPAAQGALVAAYGLNEQSGTTATDASGNGNTGTMTNTTRVTGQFGSARNFAAGSNALSNLGNGTTLRITGSMTISAWIKPSSFPDDDAVIVSKRDGDSGYQLDTTIDKGPRTVGFKLTTGAGGKMYRYGATALQANTWYHVAGVYNAPALTMNVYLNGVLDNGPLVGTVASSQLDQATNVNIGRKPVQDGYPFFGSIDEVRIYNNALTQAQIQADMNTSVVTLAPDTTAPTVPASLFATTTGTTTIKATWDASTDYYGVTAYKVERCQGAGCTNFAQVGMVTDSPFPDSGLTPGASYSYRVRATDAAGNLSGYSAVSSATTLAAPPSGGRVGIYPFEEGSGGTTADLSDVHNVGTLHGPTWTTAGKFGNALVFNTDIYVDLGNPGMLQLTSSMTISAWIDASAFPADDAVIVSKRTGADNLGYQLDTTIDKGPRSIGFKLTTGGGGQMYRYGASALQANTWYHVAGVYDAQAQTMKVYLNGVLDNGPTVGSVASSQMDRPINVNIGRKPGANGYEFIGKIDEVRIYNRALTQAEIQADMNSAATGGTTPDSVAPSAPGALGATVAGAGQINLAWNASTDNVGVTGYRVERCQGAGCGSFVQIATPVATTFSDTGLAGATSYSYRVRAIDAAGNLSAYSNLASATTPAVQAQMYFIYSDQLNTPRMIANQGGTTVWRNDNTEPFGNSVPNGDPGNTGVAFDFPLRFPGQYFDRETNLHYNYFRDCYDPVTGRYCESDPISVGQHARIWMAGLASSRLTDMKERPPLAINPYPYVVNNPLKWVDPTGLLEPDQTGPYPMPPGDHCPLVEEVSLGVIPPIYPLFPLGLSAWLCVYNCCKTCPPKENCMVTNIQYSFYGTSVGCVRYIKRPS